MKSSAVTIGLTVAIVWTSSAFADDMMSGETAFALDTFYGMCLTDAFHAEEASAFAKEIAWKPLPEEIAKPFEPPAPQVFFEGWLAFASEDGPAVDQKSDPKSLPFFAFFGQGSKDEKPSVETCTVFFRGTDAKEFLDVFVEETEAKKVDEQATFFQKTLTFSIPRYPQILAAISVGKRDGARDVAATAIHLSEPINP